MCIGLLMFPLFVHKLKQTGNENGNLILCEVMPTKCLDQECVLYIKITSSKETKRGTLSNITK